MVSFTVIGMNMKLLLPGVFPAFLIVVIFKYSAKYLYLNIIEIMIFISYNGSQSLS